MKSYQFIIIGFFLPIIFFGCGGGRIDPIDVVPSNTAVLVILELSRIPSGSKVGDLIKINELESDLSAMKIDANKVSQIVVFAGEGAYHSGDGSAGVIIQCKFNPGRNIKNLTGEDWKKEEYKGKSYYINPVSHECMMQLGRNCIVSGSETDMKSIIHVRKGKVDSVRGDPKFKKILSHFSIKDAPVYGYFMLPKVAVDVGNVAIAGVSGISSLMGLGIIGTILQKIGMVEGFGISIDEEKGSLPVEMICIMGSESAASFVCGSLGLLRGITGIVPQSTMSVEDKKSIESFRNMVFSREDELLSIKLDMMDVRGN